MNSTRHLKQTTAFFTLFFSSIVSSSLLLGAVKPPANDNEFSENNKKASLYLQGKSCTLINSTLYTEQRFIFGGESNEILCDALKERPSSLIYYIKLPSNMIIGFIGFIKNKIGAVEYVCHVNDPYLSQNVNLYLKNPFLLATKDFLKLHPTIKGIYLSIPQKNVGSEWDFKEVFLILGFKQTDSLRQDLDTFYITREEFDKNPIND